MSRTLNEIKEAIPEPSQKIEILAHEFDRVQNLHVLISTDGGKELVLSLREQCATLIGKLLRTAQEDKPDLISLLSIISQYSARLELLSLLRETTTLKEIDEQLQEAVKEFA